MIDRKTGDDADLIIEDRWPRNAGAVAQAAVDKTSTHLRDNEASTARHLTIAEEVENLARTVVSGTNRINAAVFVDAWGQAPELAKVNNWFQHDYNQYRTQLVDQGRATVTEALHDMDACNEKCVTTLRTALEA